MRFEVIATAPSEQVPDDECWGDGGVREVPCWRHIRWWGAVDRKADCMDKDLLHVVKLTTESWGGIQPLIFLWINVRFKHGILDSRGSGSEHEKVPSNVPLLPFAPLCMGKWPSVVCPFPGESYTTVGGVFMHSSAVRVVGLLVWGSIFATVIFKNNCNSDTRKHASSFVVWFLGFWDRFSICSSGWPSSPNWPWTCVESTLYQKYRRTHLFLSTLLKSIDFTNSVNFLGCNLQSRPNFPW